MPDSSDTRAMRLTIAILMLAASCAVPARAKLAHSVQSLLRPVGAVSPAFALPKVFTDELYRLTDVCDDVKTANRKARALIDRKRYAIVILSQAACCDGGDESCLGATRNLSDPCNRFVQGNFALYREAGDAQPPAGPEADKCEINPVRKVRPGGWDLAAKAAGLPANAAFLIVDTEDCVPVGAVLPEEIAKGEDRAARAKATKASIVKALLRMPKPPRELVSLLGDPSEVCSEHERKQYPDLKRGELSEALKAQSALAKKAIRPPAD